MFNKGDILENRDYNYPKVIRIDGVRYDYIRFEPVYECWFGSIDEGHLSFEYVTGVSYSFLDEYINSKGGHYICQK